MVNGITFQVDGEDSNYTKSELAIYLVIQTLFFNEALLTMMALIYFKNPIEIKRFKFCCKPKQKDIQKQGKVSKQSRLSLAQKEEVAEDSSVISRKLTETTTSMLDQIKQIQNEMDSSNFFDSIGHELKDT